MNMTKILMEDTTMMLIANDTNATNNEHGKDTNRRYNKDTNCQ